MLLLECNDKNLSNIVQTNFGTSNIDILLHLSIAKDPDPNSEGRIASMSYLNIAFLHQYLLGLLAQRLNLKHVGTRYGDSKNVRSLEHQDAPNIPAFGEAGS